MPTVLKIIPISDLRQNASDVIKSVSSSREPVFITQRGRAAAVMVSMERQKESSEEGKMKNMRVIILLGLFSLGMGGLEVWAQEYGPAQKRIMIERAEKVTGKKLDLLKRVVEKYQNCRVLFEGNELTGFVINGKTYRDFTVVIRDTKKIIIVVTADGVVSFDY
jgi:prevent-host-death family protein